MNLKLIELLMNIKLKRYTVFYNVSMADLPSLIAYKINQYLFMAVLHKWHNPSWSFGLFCQVGHTCTTCYNKRGCSITISRRFNACLVDIYFSYSSRFIILHFCLSSVNFLTHFLHSFAGDQTAFGDHIVHVMQLFEVFPNCWTFVVVFCCHDGLTIDLAS